MPKIAVIPKGIKAYVYHGVLVEYSEGNEEGVADCPFCSKPKFYLSLETGQYQCKSCGEKGEPYTFIRHLHALSMEATSDYSWIVEHRKIKKELLREWGVCLSFLTQDWIIPGYNREGQIINLYRYTRNPVTGKYLLYGTPGMNISIHGFDDFDESKPDIYICEGPWDGMVLRDKLRTTKRTDDGSYLPTANESLSILSTCNVVAVPGSQAFSESWNKVVEGKAVSLLYDNDYPRKNKATGAVVEPSGFTGMRHAAGVMASAPEEERYKSLSYLYWGSGGYTQDYADGFDVRDMLGTYKDGLQRLYGMLQPVPSDWTEGKSLKRGEVKIECVSCNSWEELVNEWKLAMDWGDGLEGCLAIGLASIASVKAPGEQLWFKMISPPSSGKTSILAALSVNRKYVIEDSGINGFYSGYKIDKEGKEDFSLAARLYDKTFITAEGATLLSSPYKDVILGQARQLYDGSAHRKFNNGKKLDYEGLRFTWIIGGTKSLRLLDKSELGQRMLDYVLMDEIDDNQEDRIGLRAAYRQARNSQIESNCKAETTMDRDYVSAMQLTGGYVEYLRKHATYLIGQVELSDATILKCHSYGKFVAHMRARPSGTGDDGEESRELSPRVTQQLVKLAQYLAVVLNRKSVDKVVMKWIRKVTFDTARGRTLEIAKVLYDAGEKGMDSSTLSKYTNQNTVKEGDYLKFLRKIKATEHYTPEPERKLGSKVRWRLTSQFRKLYREVTS